MNTNPIYAIATLAPLAMFAYAGCQASHAEEAAPTRANPAAPGQLLDGPELARAEDDGKIIVAAPGKVCRAKGGTFGSSFDVRDLGEPHLQVIRSVALDTKLVKTGDELQVKVLRNNRGISGAELAKRTSEFVETDGNGFSHVLLFSGETIKVKVFPGEKISVQDAAMRNFGKKACVQLRPERLPAE